MKILIFSLSVGFFFISAQSLFAAAELPNDSRIKILEYRNDDVYTIHTLYGYQTNIEFSEGEEVQTISVGDRSLWQLIPSGNRLFIRPLDEDVSTNMTIITNYHSYQFDIVAGKGTPKQNPDLIYVARFSYPKTRPVPYGSYTSSFNQYGSEVPTFSAPVAASVPPVPSPIALSAPNSSSPISTPVELKDDAKPAQLNEKEKLVASKPDGATLGPVSTGKDDKYNYLYSYTGKDNLAPTDTYDDGKQTYIHIANVKQMPKIYALNEKGERVPVPYKIQKGIFLIPDVRDRYALVYGKGKEQTVHIYNESLKPATVVYDRQ